MKIYIILVGFAVGLMTYIGLTAENTQSDPGVRFDHQYHIQDEEIECETCHTEATTSATGADNLFPDHDACSDCHDPDDDDGCGDCHTNTDDPSGFPEIVKYSTLFSHKMHNEKGLNCEDCHSVVAKKTYVLPYELPDMANCMDCHDERNASLECESCHMEGEELRPGSHTPNFLHNHSDIAQMAADEVSGDMSCTTCHSVNYCQDCHQGFNLDRMTHPLNYVATHSLEAQGKQKDCTSCHVDQQFCMDCHNMNHVMPHNHTAGWALPSPTDGGRHRTEAQNDLDNCRSCHEANAPLVCGNAGCHPGMN